MVDITKRPTVAETLKPPEEPPKVTVDDSVCQNCKFFLDPTDSNTICRRYPPTPAISHDAAVYTNLKMGSPLAIEKTEVPGWQVLKNIQTMFPTVLPHWFCGEFVRKVVLK